MSSSSPSASPSVPADFSARFLSSLHVSFIQGLDSPSRRDSFEWCATEHLRMSGVYWSLMALELMGSLHVMDRQRIIDWVLSCRDDETGGYGGNCGHDAHLLYTLSAVQILVLLDAEDRLDTAAVTAFVAQLQQPDGSFWGDRWGETDTRFSYCAINLLSLLGRLHTVDVPQAMKYIARCRNFDGGFGAVPGAESHAGMSQAATALTAGQQPSVSSQAVQLLTLAALPPCPWLPVCPSVFACVGALALGDGLSLVDSGLLSWWLSERQLPEGGLNGRPEKLADVCYSWWVLSSLSILQRLHYVAAQPLISFILDAQDADGGGIADRPGNLADPFHTYFGIAALSLLGCPQLQPIDPLYALPVRCIQRLGVSKGKWQTG